MGSQAAALLRRNGNDFGALNIAVPAMINSQIGSCLYPAKPPVCFDATFHVLQRFRIESRLDPRNIGKRGSCVYAPRFEPPSMGNVEQQRSEEHTSELQSPMRISYAVFCLKKKKKNNKISNTQ